jgi:hypothetical protein
MLPHYYPSSEAKWLFEIALKALSVLLIFGYGRVMDVQEYRRLRGL